MAPTPPLEKLEGKERSEKEAALSEQAELQKNLVMMAEKAKEGPPSEDEDSDDIAKLSGEIAPEHQKEGLLALQARLTTLITALKKIGVDVSILKKYPEKLQTLIHVNYQKLRVELGEDQFTRLNNAHLKLQILLKEEGPTSNMLKASDYWITTVGEGVSIWEDPFGKYKEYYKKDAPLTALATIAAAVGIGVTLKWLLSDSDKEAPASTSPTAPVAEKKFWTKNKKIAALIGIPAVLFLGKDKAMEWMSTLMKDKTLAFLGFDGETTAEIQKAIELGTVLSPETRQKLANSGEKGQEILTAIDTKAGTPSSIEGESSSATVEKITLGETVNAQRYLVTVQALIGLYEMDKPRDEKMPAEINVVFESFAHHSIKTLEVVKAYQAAKAAGKTEISFESLGLVGNGDMSPESLFHAAVILNKAYEYHEKRFPGTVTENNTVKEFLVGLGNDPALSVAHSVQNAMTQKFKDLKISSPTDLVNQAQNIFESDAIDSTIEEHKEQFIEHLAQKYGIDLSSFTAQEKMAFMTMIGSLYMENIEGNHKLNSGDDTIRIAVQGRKMSEKVTEASILFWKELRNQTEPLLNKSITRFDLQRPDNPKYDRVLENNLKFKSLHFSDGLQLALLSDGVNFETEPGGEDLGQTKEVSMVFLMASLLKKRAPQAHTLYMANLIDLATPGRVDLKLNPYFKTLAPYFKKLFGMLTGKCAEWLTGLDEMIAGQRTLGGDPNRLEEIKNMSTIEYAFETGKSGLVEGYRIPRDLVLTVYETFKDIDNTPDDAKTFFDKILGAGGIIFYSNRGGENVGYVYWAGKYFLIEPIGAAIDGLQATLTGSPWVGAKAYLVGTAPFIVLGALNGLRNGKSVLEGMGKGLAAPVNMPVAGYRAVRGANRYIKRWVTNPLKFGSGNTANLEMSSRLFQEYSRKAPTGSGGWFDRLEMAYDKAKTSTSLKGAEYQIRRAIYAEHYEQARVKWGKIFARDYNHFFDLNPEDPNDKLALKVRHGHNVDEELRLKAEKMHQVTSEIKSMKDMGKLEEAKFFEKLEIALGDKFKEQLEALKARSKKIGFESFREAVMAVSEEKISQLAGTATPKVLSPAEALTKPKALWNGKYRYMGEEFSLNGSEKNLLEMAAEGEPRETALKNLLHEKWSNPDFVSEGPAGKLYRYRGGTYVISEAERAAQGGNLDAAIEQKYIKSIQIEDTRIFEEVTKGLDGKEVVKKYTEYKIKGEWIRPPEGPDGDLRAKKSFAEAAKTAGIPLEHMDLSNTRVIKYFPLLEKLMGPVMAVGVITHLETAVDKKKALAETGVGLATFMAGAKGAEKLSNLIRTTSPAVWAGKKVFTLLGGLAAAYELTEPISDILESAIPKFMGDKETFAEMAEMASKLGYYQAGKGTLKLIGKETLHAGGKLALDSLSKVIPLKIKASVGKKITQFMSTSLMKRLSLSMGLKGTVIGATAVTPVPFDDVIAWTVMAPWMAKDVYDIWALRDKCSKMQAAMERFESLPRTIAIDENDVISQKTFEAAVANSPKPLEEMSEKERGDFMLSLPDIRLKFTYAGSTGYEIHRFVQGEIYSSQIYTESGEMLELSDEEMNREIALPLPQEFDPSKIKINYETPPEELKANLRMAILFTKSECGWSKLDHEFVGEDNKTILIKRLDGGQGTRITRTGDKWSVEGHSEGHDIFQALVLANLKNKVQGILEKEGHVGGTSRPFSIDGERIDFDKSWSMFDLSILSEGSANFFFDKIHLDKRMIVNMLNNWYQKEGRTLALAA